MPIVNSSGKYVPDYDSCETVEELEKEFKEWAYRRCLVKFGNDYKITDEEILKQEYKDHITTSPKDYYIMSTSEGNYFYYVGSDVEFKKEIQQNKKTMENKRQKKKIADGYSDIKNNVNQFNKNIHDSLNGKYDYDDETRQDLKNLAKTLKDKTVTEKDKRDAIDAINAKYNLNIASDATSKEVSSMANKTTGGIFSNLNEAFAGTGNAISESWGIMTDGNFSTYFDRSDNEYIKAFTDQGITGDILWGAITGKYNKDQKAKEALVKFTEDLNSGKLTEEQKVNRLKELNEKYKLNLSADVTPEEIAEIIESNQNMQYKKKVSDIAKGLIENKINEIISEKLDEKLGPIMRSLGIKFSFKDRNIIQDIRDIVRGVKKIEFDQEKFLKNLHDTLEKKIDKLIEEKVYKQIDEYAKKANKYVDDYAKKINDKLDVYRKKINEVSDKIENWINNPESFQLLIANKLETLVKSPVEKVAGLLDKLDKPLEKIGLGGLGLGNMFRTISGIFVQGMAEKIRTAAQPILKKALTITKTISETIKKAMEAINKLRDQVKAMIETWKNTLKDAIAAQTKKLVNEITKYVRLQISGFAGSITI